MEVMTRNVANIMIWLCHIPLWNHYRKQMWHVSWQWLWQDTTVE